VTVIRRVVARAGLAVVVLTALAGCVSPLPPPSSTTTTTRAPSALVQVSIVAADTSRICESFPVQFTWTVTNTSAVGGPGVTIRIDAVEKLTDWSGPVPAFPQAVLAPGESTSASGVLSGFDWPWIRVRFTVVETGATYAEPEFASVGCAVT
jgi:hypothetical protein